MQFIASAVCGGSAVQASIGFRLPLALELCLAFARFVQVDDFAHGPQNLAFIFEIRRKDSAPY